MPRECLNKQVDEKYNRISKILSKYMYLDPDLEREKEKNKQNQSTNPCRDPLTGPFTAILTKSENLKIIKTENGLLDSWEPKNISYLIKRSLDIFPDPVWRHKSIQTPTSNTTYIQRRFQQNLRNVETIDLVFSSKVFKKLINYNPLPGAPYFFQVNLRLAGTALSGTQYILPAHYLPTEIIDDTKKEVTLRVHIGQIIRETDNYLLHADGFPLKRDPDHLYFFDHPEVNPDGNIYLKEMILLARDHQNDFFETFPLKRIDFLGFKTPEINPMDKSVIPVGRVSIKLKIFNEFVPPNRIEKNIQRSFN